MEIETKKIYGLKKAKYMVITTGNAIEEEEAIEERVKEEIVQEIWIFASSSEW